MSQRAAKSQMPVLSVVLTVGDDEEVVGYRVRALVEHLRGKQIPFEILAVNAGSRDNSFALLALLTQQEPALRLFPKPTASKAFLRGASEACGEFVALMETAAPLSLAPLGWALGRLGSRVSADGGPFPNRRRDALMLRGRYVVARRMAVLPLLVNVPGPGPFFERRFERAGHSIGLMIVGTRPKPAPGSLGSGGLLAPLLRLLAA